VLFRSVPGGDADLVLFDPKAEWAVDRTQMLTKARDTARLFDGATLRGRVTKTLVRGTVVYEDGRIVGPAGHGKFVKPRR